MKIRDYGKYLAYMVIIFTLLLWCMNQEGYTLFLTKQFIFHNVFCYLIMINLVLIYIFLLPSFRKYISAYVGVFLAGIFLIFIMDINYGILSNHYVTEIHSPDHKHTIVIYEYSSMFNNWGIIYEKKNFFYMRKSGKYMTDFLFPVHDRDYSVQWKKHSLVLTYEYTKKDTTLVDGSRIKNTDKIDVQFSR